MNWLFKKNKKKPNQIFIPCKNEFMEMNEGIGNKSLNDISTMLGYHPDQVYYIYDYTSKYKIHCIGVEIFTKNVIFIRTEGYCSKIDELTIQHFLSKQNETDLYNISNIDTLMKNGIKSRSLTIEYLSRVLDIKNPDKNGVFFVEKFNLYLYFIDGTLVDYTISNGLNMWAQRLNELNPELIQNYLDSAKKYWGDDTKNILHEVNSQADAWASTPNSFSNEFINLHLQDFNTVNFVMLLVSHYNYNITLPEFLKINHGRSEAVYDNQEDGELHYKVGKFMYKFSRDGELIETY